MMIFTIIIMILIVIILMLMTIVIILISIIINQNQMNDNILNICQMTNGPIDTIFLLNFIY